MPKTDGKPRLQLLLDHFALIEDDREPGRVAHPLPEVLLLVVCGTIGALVTIDAIACNPKVAEAVVEAGTDYLTAVKANQPGLLGEIERFFNDTQSPPPDRTKDIGKGHGRVEERRVAVSTQVDWMKGERRFPGEYLLPDIAAIIMVETETFEKDKVNRRFYVSSRAMAASQAASAIRAHWAIETSLHWILEVTFNEDKARGRTGHGPANMGVLRHFAFNLIRMVDAPLETTSTSKKSFFLCHADPDSGLWCFPRAAGKRCSGAGFPRRETVQRVDRPAPPRAGTTGLLGGQVPDKAGRLPRQYSTGY